MSASSLWAPWRMEYILGKKGSTCVFCEYARAEAQSFRSNLVLVRQPHALVCLNRYPFAASHLLVLPTAHVANLGELALESYTSLMVLLREAAIRLQSATKAEGLNIGFNLGQAAGAGIAEHLHAHIVPRWSGDTNFMPVIAGTRVMPDYLDETYKRLAPYFEDLSGGGSPAE